ncbi:type II secretion system minor pseudopilin GspJ [Rheinheimera texasensis]|uniref:type II secretion system minor pseudopilin GspJ n=1 Tax=Rheinheimera texasensis TaxID=306205 RepID=UPI0004E24C75|nr:type II secretion system minor pseudopilin GspJ [Rheinheimera texasensis]
MQNNRGFTFIEMLLAVAIFALVGLASVAVLDSVTRSDEASRAATLRLQQLQRAMMVIERDFWQISARQIRVNGEAPVAQTLAGAVNWIESDDDGISFSHAGWTNPGMVLARSEVQLVGYRLKERQLQRLYYLYPDAVTGTEPNIQPLLEDIDELKFRYLVKEDGQEQWKEFWDQGNWPLAVKMTLKSPQLGVIERVFGLPLKESR